MQDWIARHGVPHTVVTNGARDWQGSFQKLLDRYGIKHETTAAYNPQSSGKVERAVGTLKRCLQRYVADGTLLEEWDLKLPEVLLGYRSAAQNSSPALLLYGRELVVTRPGQAPEASGSMDDNSLEEEKTLRSYLDNRRQMLDQKAEMAASNFAAAQEKQKEAYSRRRQLDAN